MERNRAWEQIERHFMSFSVKRFLSNELRKDESDLFNDRPWTRHSLLRAGICPFGRKGTNNPVEQVNATQVDQRHFEHYHPLINQRHPKWENLGLQRARFTKKTPFFPILATLSVLESSLLSIRALFDAFKRL